MNGLVYDFVFGKYDKDAEGEKDDRIKDTVVSVVKDIFEKDPNAILCYICDHSDNQEKARERLFKIWYNNHLLTEADHLGFNFGTVGIYGAILFSTISPINAFVKEAFYKEFD